MPEPESAILTSIIKWLQLVHVFAWRNNTGSVSVLGRRIRFGHPGSGDILGILPDGRFLSIECKAKKNKPSEVQVAFMDRTNRDGGLAFPAWSLDEVIQKLMDEGYEFAGRMKL